ncbi:MAG: DUF2809 domain-containing protein [bacterium]
MSSSLSESPVHLNYRTTLLVSLLVITPLGFASKFYRGPLAWWFNDHLGGLLYEMFWILLIILIWPKLSPFWVACGVFLVTCALEFLQLWHPPFLQLIRSTFLGRTVIGTSFTWWDFPYYIVGCAAGSLWLRYVRQKSGGPRSN